MDILAKVLGVTKLNQLKKEQLDRQVKIDEKLASIQLYCPSAISDFLLTMRKYSRIDQYKIVNANLIDKSKAVEDEIISSRGFYNKLDIIIDDPHNKPFSKCNNIMQLTREINSNLNN
jgi:Rad3-related DNA helicase